MPHMHVHVIPRKGGDFPVCMISIAINHDQKNDEIYQQLDADRKPRQFAEMEEEANMLRSLVPPFHAFDMLL